MTRGFIGAGNGLPAQRGLSLIEVLVTIVIVAIGLLGLAGLHLNGLQASQNAQHRTAATHLLYDIADRLRANPAGARDGHYDHAFTQSAGVGGPGCGNPQTECSPAQLAQHDIHHWGQRLADGGDGAPFLPQGQAQITRNGDTLVVQISWQYPQDHHQISMEVTP